MVEAFFVRSQTQFLVTLTGGEGSHVVTAVKLVHHFGSTSLIEPDVVAFGIKPKRH